MVFFNKIYRYDTLINDNKNSEFFFKRIENMFNSATIVVKTFKDLKYLKKARIYKYCKIKQPKILVNSKFGVFNYIIGLKNTSTNLYYNIARTNGKIIFANTKNRVLSKIVDSNQNSITKNTDIYYLVKALKIEANSKVRKKSSVLLFLRNFKRFFVKKIIRNLAHIFNIKALVIENTNPHNGCRPSKIKTNTKLRFRRHIVLKKHELFGKKVIG